MQTSTPTERPRTSFKISLDLLDRPFLRGNFFNLRKQLDLFNSRINCKSGRFKWLSNINYASFTAGIMSEVVRITTLRKSDISAR